MSAMKPLKASSDTSVRPCVFKLGMWLPGPNTAMASATFQNTVPTRRSFEACTAKWQTQQVLYIVSVVGCVRA